MPEQNNITNSLAHTKWNCKYHIVFAPKYRRKVFFEEKRLEIREILRTLCQWKGVEVIEGEICPDHIHMLVSIPPLRGWIIIAQKTPKGVKNMDDFTDFKSIY